MTVMKDVVNSLDALQASLRHDRVGSSAFVSKDTENLSKELVDVFKSIAGLKGYLIFTKDMFDVYRIQGSDHKAEFNHLTGEVFILTKAGKVIVPKTIKIKTYR